MAKSEVLTGDQIAKDIKGKSADDSFADIAREVHDMIDHTKRPAAELAKVTEALHAQGILPGIELTGVQGQDFIGRDSNGAVVKVDALDLSHVKVDSTSKTTEINGREATIAADGSGQVTVKPGDSAWRIAKDVLKSQGIANPDDRQVHMYEIQMETLNGKDAVNNLHPGDVLKLPPALEGGIDSSFFGARALDTETAAKAQLTGDYQAASAAMTKSNHWHFGAPLSMDMDELSREMSQPGLTDQEKKGYQYLKDHFNEIAVDGTIWQDKLDAWNHQQIVNAELTFFKNTNGGMM